MILKLLSVFLVTVITINSVRSQTKSYSDILPKGIEARPILDTINYLPDSLQQPVLDVLKAQGFDLTKCFVDKRIELDKKGASIFISIWDVDDLKHRKSEENLRKDVPYQHTHPGFYSGTIEYHIKTKTAEFLQDE